MRSRLHRPRGTRRVGQQVALNLPESPVVGEQFTPHSGRGGEAELQVLLLVGSRAAVGFPVQLSRSMADGPWLVAGGRWLVADGWWPMAGGGCRWHVVPGGLDQRAGAGGQARPLVGCPRRVQAVVPTQVRPSPGRCPRQGPRSSPPARTQVRDQTPPHPGVFRLGASQIIMVVAGLPGCRVAGLPGCRQIRGVRWVCGQRGSYRLCGCAAVLGWEAGSSSLRRPSRSEGCADVQVLVQPADGPVNSGRRSRNRLSHWAHRRRRPGGAVDRRASVATAVNGRLCSAGLGRAPWIPAIAIEIHETRLGPMPVG
jgi:hypothetical protein